MQQIIFGATNKGKTGQRDFVHHIPVVHMVPVVPVVPVLPLVLLVPVVPVNILETVVPVNIYKPLNILILLFGSIGTVLHVNILDSYHS